MQREELGETVINLGQIRRFSKSHVGLSLINNFNKFFLDNNGFKHCSFNIQCDVKIHGLLKEWNMLLIQRRQIMSPFGNYSA